ncbi:hypothetical protein [Rhizobium sp. MHM7A]|uniref:hypothetical protein n=1 Tax=Rhizobium sp. MHM7A TaxID=2583233 RepID=UPI001106005E|nr:hypothetical protein [Rhizobium sp. MHM7A]TLX15900.1 hypothetical protein FFR93_00880 [Rhizobium sp. MHM7A]
MTATNSWVKFSISRSTSPDNEKLGIDRWEQATIADYGKLVEAELVDFIDTKQLSFIGFVPYGNEAYYTLTATLAFDATYPTPAKTHIEGLGMQLARALSESSQVDIEAIVINDFTFTKESILNSKREAFTTDLLNLTEALKDVTSLTTPWFEFQVNEKDLQGDTLIPVLEAQIARMEVSLTVAKNKPFTGQGGNKTHDQQTRVIFMNTGSKDGKMSELLREKVVNGDTKPEEIISELKAARDALVALTIGVDFHGKPPRLVPGEEVHRLAKEYGPTIDRGGAQMRPDYLERTLSDFPLDTLHGKMMRYGMFLAAQLAMEIREGAGGTANIRDLHSRLANELGATVVPPQPAADEDYAPSPGL